MLGAVGLRAVVGGASAVTANEQAEAPPAERVVEQYGERCKTTAKIDPGGVDAVDGGATGWRVQSDQYSVRGRVVERLRIVYWVGRYLCGAGWYGVAWRGVAWYIVAWCGMA